MATTVLDGYAILAYLWDDLGGEKVEALLTKAALSNRPVHMTEAAYMEIKAILLRKSGLHGWAKASEVMRGLPIEFHSISRSLAENAADLKARFNLNSSNAFTAALAQEKRAEIVAGDAGLKELRAEIKIVWIGAE